MVRLPLALLLTAVTWTWFLHVTVPQSPHLSNGDGTSQSGCADERFRLKTGNPYLLLGVTKLTGLVRQLPEQDFLIEKDHKTHCTIISLSFPHKFTGR